MKNAIKLLTEARAILARPFQLTRFQPACDLYGRTVSPLHPAACRWCSTGAVLKAAGMEHGEQIDVALAALQRAMDGSIPNFHDHRLRHEILERFDKAVQMLEYLEQQEQEHSLPFGAVVVDYHLDLLAIMRTPQITTA